MVEKSSDCVFLGQIYHFFLISNRTIAREERLNYVIVRNGIVPIDGNIVFQSVSQKQ